VKPPAGPPWSVTDDRRRQTPASKTLCVGWPVIIPPTRVLTMDAASVTRCRPNGT